MPLSGNDITTYYDSGDEYSVKVYNDDGTPVGKNHAVTFDIAGKTYKAKTNENGIASLKITEKPGNYKITATYGYSLTHDVVVKQILNLEPVKVKKSAKKLVLKTTLKQGQKAMASKRVTFKFNGKTYTAKTNSAGVAKVTIKKSVLNKLKEGKTINYQVSYGESVVKKSVKVQK